jgi:hypothetical protein
MRTWMIWTVAPISDPALREFAALLGSKDTVNDDAVIEDGGARVYISRADVDDQENVLIDDVEYATQELGFRPASMLSMRIGHDALALAETVAAMAIKRWGGLLDRNAPSDA